MQGPPYNAWAERLPDRPLCAQVCERPLMFLLDTPGVLAPRIQSVEMGLKLALCGKWGGFEGGRQAWRGGPPFLDVAVADASGLCWASRPSSLCGPSSQLSRARHRPGSRSPRPGEHLPSSVYCRGRAKAEPSGPGPWRADAGLVFRAHTGLLVPGTVLDHLVGEETLADYLLYTLNRHQLFG